MLIFPGFIHEVETIRDSFILAGNFILPEFFPMCLFYHTLDIELKMSHIDCFPEVVVTQVVKYLGVPFDQRKPYEHDTLIHSPRFFQHFISHHLIMRKQKNPRHKENHLTNKCNLKRLTEKILFEYSEFDSYIDSWTGINIPTDWTFSKLSFLPDTISSKLFQK